MIPEKIKRKIPKIRETENQKDPIVHVKLFHPCSNWTWYITEYDNEEDLCFGLVDGFEIELGYFSLQELQEINIRSLSVEVDKFWSPTPLSEVKKRIMAKRQQ